MNPPPLQYRAGATEEPWPPIVRMTLHGLRLTWWAILTIIIIGAFLTTVYMLLGGLSGRNSRYFSGFFPYSPLLSR